ncbi:hypothetical protein [Mycobacterium sp. GA-2829]|uniref:hypothetical protein n=1 Tax=Mycobacterium sp. GA-2829 TaxID=1772283 RepID=UPI00074026BD|nr:hypothetical protein [Mycobacterium sp. GA-2829]KUI38602.1 hypothetical protein AU194_08930 [Mycobacterium sp. GA-2829]
MHLAARSYLATGVALVGAGAIAISPVAPPLPDVKVPTLSTIGVELNAAVNPIQTWIDVFGTTAENLAILGQMVAENPAPILQQVIENQLGYIEKLAPAFQDFAVGFVEALDPFNPDGIPANVVDALELIVTGHPAQGFPELFQAFLTPILFPALGVLVGVQEVITATAENMLDVANMAVTVFATVALGVLSPIATGFGAVGVATQAIVDAAVDGDILGAITAALDVPGFVTGAVLNGFDFNGGLLTPEFGTIAGLLNLRQMIADALKPAAPVLRVADVPSTDTEAADTVTSDITESGVTGASFKSAVDAGDASESYSPEPDDVIAVVDEKAGDETVVEPPEEEAPVTEAPAEEATEEEENDEEAAQEDAADEDVTEQEPSNDENGSGGADNGGGDSESGNDNTDNDNTGNDNGGGDAE